MPCALFGNNHLVATFRGLGKIGVDQFCHLRIAAFAGFAAQDNGNDRAATVIVPDETRLKPDARV